MKNKFDKEFKKEFEKQFQPSINTDDLKQQLNLEPTKLSVFTFKKKHVYSFCIVVMLLLTSITLFAVRSIKEDITDYEQNHIPITKDNDIIKMFEQKYPSKSVSLVSNISTKTHIDVTLINVSADQDYVLFVLYFNEVYDTNILNYEYDFTVNSVSYKGQCLEANNYIEFLVDFSSSYEIDITVSFCDDLIFEYHTVY